MSTFIKPSSWIIMDYLAVHISLMQDLDSIPPWYEYIAVTSPGPYPLIGRLDISISVVCGEFHVLSFIWHFLTFSAVCVLFPMLCASINMLNLSAWSLSPSNSSGACLAALAGKFDPTSFKAFWHPDHCFQLILCSGAFSMSPCMLNVFAQVPGPSNSPTCTLVPPNSRPSVVTWHGHSWKKIHTKSKVTACECKAEPPTKFNTSFVWDDEGEDDTHWARVSSILISADVKNE